MNIVSLLARSAAGVALVSTLVTGCGSGDATAPSETGPAAEPAGPVPDLLPIGPTPRNCPLSADQADRAIERKAVPECLRARQREAQQEYRRRASGHPLGHL